MSSAALELINILTVGAMAVLIGIILNSKNTIGLVNAITNLYGTTFGAATSTIR